MRGLRTVIPLLFVALIFGACGGDDGGDGSSGVDLDGATLAKNLEAAGYTIEEADPEGLPATVGSFATNPDSGFEQGYTGGRSGHRQVREPQARSVRAER